MKLDMNLIKNCLFCKEKLKIFNYGKNSYCVKCKPSNIKTDLESLFYLNKPKDIFIMWFMFEHEDIALKFIQNSDNEITLSIIESLINDEWNISYYFGKILEELTENNIVKIAIKYKDKYMKLRLLK